MWLWDILKNDFKKEEKAAFLKVRLCLGCNYFDHMQNLVFANMDFSAYIHEYIANLGKEGGYGC